MRPPKRGVEGQDKTACFKHRDQLSFFYKFAPVAGFLVNVCVERFAIFLNSYTSSEGVLHGRKTVFLFTTWHVAERKAEPAHFEGETPPACSVDLCYFYAVAFEH